MGNPFERVGNVEDVEGVEGGQVKSLAGAAIEGSKKI